MNDLTMVPVEKRKEALAAMKTARDHMGIALDRIQALESALRNARFTLQQSKEFMPAKAYTYDGKQKVTDFVDSQIATIAKVLAG